MNEKTTTEEQKSKQIEQNVKLCRAVQAQRCVYDRQNPCQKKECYDKAWEIIAKECNDTAETIESEEDASWTPQKGSGKTLKSTTTNAQKKKTTTKEDNNDDELTTSADETANEEQNIPKRSNRSTLSKSSAPELTNKGTRSVVPTSSSDTKVKQNDHLPTTSSDAVRDFRFRRACKRGLDKSVLQQLGKLKRDVDPKRPRRSAVGRKSLTLKQIAKNAEAMLKNKSSPVKELKTPTKNSMPEQKVLSPKAAEKLPVVKVLESPDLSVPECEKFDYDLPESIETTPQKLCETLLTKCDQAVQCDANIDTWDDEFLNTLRPQMAVMNSRQKLHFKQKVYYSLMEVFDDSSNFPGPGENSAIATASPPLQASAGEMTLIRELVAMVQAAKSSPDFNEKPVLDELHERSESAHLPVARPNAMPEAATTSTQSQQLKGRQYSQFLRPKIVKNNGDGTYTTNEATPRVFRLLTKPNSAISKSKVGTFIIPRAPNSIASSANAAVVVAEAAKKNFQGTSNSYYRKITMPDGGTVLVNSTQGFSVNSKSSPNRLMTIHNSVRPTGTCVPRQIIRRFSVGGSTANGANKPFKTPMASTIPPQLDLRSSTASSSSTTTTAKLPYRPPPAPTMVTQSLRTQTTPTIVQTESSSSADTAPPFTLSTSTAKISIGSMGALKNFSLKHSNPASTNASSTPLQNVTENSKSKETEKSSDGIITAANNNSHPIEIMSAFGVQEDSAGIILSDDYNTFDIKNEPID